MRGTDELHLSTRRSSISGSKHIADILSPMPLERFILEAAQQILEARRTKITAQIEAIKTMIGGGGSIIGNGILTAAKKPRKKRKPLSPEALERIRAAQKKRWAAARKAQKG